MGTALDSLLCPKERLLRRVDRAGCPRFFAPSTQPGVFIPIVARSPGRETLMRAASPLVAPLGTIEIVEIKLE